MVLNQEKQVQVTFTLEFREQWVPSLNDFY